MHGILRLWWLFHNEDPQRKNVLIQRKEQIYLMMTDDLRMSKLAYHRQLREEQSKQTMH